MTLDCAGFERWLEAYVERRLSPAEARAAREHAERCESCRELLALARGRDAPFVDLTPGVMDRTSGAGCARARELLVDLAARRLGSLDAQLVRGHLAGCRDCEGLAGAVVSLERDLPLLAELDPGPGFTAAVVARTRRFVRAAARRARWMRAWQQLVLRPRFALEGAYVLTAVLLIVFGVPGELLAGFSRQVREVAAVEVPETVSDTLRQTKSRLREGAREAWNETGAPVAVDAQRSLADAAAVSARRFEALKTWAGTLWTRVASDTEEDDGRSAGAATRATENEDHERE